MKKIAFKEYWNRLGVYQGVILFMIVLFAANFFWKFTVSGDEKGQDVFFLGMDISAPFIWLTYHLAYVTHNIFSCLDIDTILRETSVLHLNGEGICIVWGCNGIKQSFIFAMILLFAKGPILHKLWYIPIGLFLVYCINVIRLVFLAWIVKDHPEQFEFWHGFVAKYLFYGLIFLIWVFWNDCLVPRLSKKASANH